MSLRATGALLLLAALGACRDSSSTRTPAADRAVDTLPPELRDATILGREIFGLVDRAADYKGSHRGRAPQSLRQMGIDSLAPLVVRRIAVVSDSAMVTVAFRQPRGRRVASCEANARILEEAALNGGKFSLVCASASGALARYEVAAP
ncbi:MAG TPA: hypothetical protein VFK09_06090 [Gemmatimonadales bacterium]|jgi:hypothetical protein|nr:hypothetical protein [Gemmatimonadales bacterium]